MSAALPHCPHPDGRHRLCYRSPAAARKNLRRTRERAPVGSRPEGFYQCRKCGAWHLTGQPGNNR